MSSTKFSLLKFVIPLLTEEGETKMPWRDIHLIITRSQQMALIDILMIYIRQTDEPQEFLDVSTNATTTTGELLRLVSSVSASHE